MVGTVGRVLFIVVSILFLHWLVRSIYKSRLLQMTSRMVRYGTTDDMKLWIIVGGFSLAAVVLVTIIIILMCRRKWRLQEQEIQKRDIEVQNRIQSSRSSNDSPAYDQPHPSSRES